MTEAMDPRLFTAWLFVFFKASGKNILFPSSLSLKELQVIFFSVCFTSRGHIG